MSDSPSTAQVVHLERKVVPIFERPEDGSSTWLEAILHKMVPDPSHKADQASSQGVNLGLKEHPFNMAAAIQFKNQNPHHSTCIEAKTRALVGLGFVDEDTVADELDPLCDSTFHEVLQSVGEDYWQVGNGYMEIIRDDGEKITGIHHVPAATVQVCIEDVSYRRHYIVGAEGEGSGPVVMAPYGELKDFLARLNGTDEDSERDDNGVTDAPSYRTFYSSYGTPSERSEIIHFARRTSMSRWYGYPDWLSAVAGIELVQCMTQERYDFFLNRGVPEFMLFFLKARVPPKEWATIQRAMEATIGPGNQHKSLAVNIDDANIEVQLEKLAMDGAGAEAAFSDMSETLALDIVTAHRTPPLLAGIQIPGKLGAVNELPNALLAFQVLVIGPEQVTFQAILGDTLGNRKLNGGLTLRKKHFKLKKVTEEIPLGLGGQTGGQGAGTDPAGAGIKKLDTMSRMRSPAAAGGRDLADGVRK